MLIKKLLEAFSFTFGQLQDIVTLIKNLEKNEISNQEFIAYIKKEKVLRLDNKRKIANIEKSSKIQWEKNALKCVECGSIMNLFPVNSNKGDQVEGNFKSQWFCPNCGNDKFSNKTVRETIVKINKE